ncbi:MAG: ComF family protein [Candidatus Sericytochromatia bacterium]|nr:ComF family protein [Candidatus Tanganyikabacteria bacterium]
MTTGLCPACRRAVLDPGRTLVGPAALEVHAVGRYVGPLRRILLDFKQGDRPDLAPWLAALMAPPDPAGGMIVPVPTSPDRVRVRGYDHALLLARQLGRAWGWPVAAGVLGRARVTPRLHAHGPRARIRLLRGAFVAIGAGRGDRVWLLDDLCTTGATLEGCRTTLAASGWGVRGGVVLARALPVMR